MHLIYPSVAHVSLRLTSLLVLRAKVLRRHVPAELSIDQQANKMANNSGRCIYNTIVADSS